MDRLTQIEVFAKTAELLSVSRAAESLGMSVAAASRHLAGLEERLGARLIERNTRRLWLTEAGTEFLQRSRQLLDDLSEAEDAVAERVVAPQGLLRVTSSLSFAMLRIAPILPEFLSLYPRLAVQISVSNRYLDFIESGMDIAIRTREYEPDSSIVVRKLGSTPRLLAASPAYLARRGTPQQPGDLTAHDMLVYNLANDPFTLNLRRGDTTARIRITSVFDCNDGQVIRQAALADMGILIQPLYIIYRDLEEGRLVAVLRDWELPILNMNVAYQNRARPPAKIKAFTDFLIGKVRSDAMSGIRY